MVDMAAINKVRIIDGFKNRLGKAAVFIDETDLRSDINLGLITDVSWMINVERDASIWQIMLQIIVYRAIGINWSQFTTNLQNSK